MSVFRKPSPGESWREGWWNGARRVDSPNFGPRPAGTAVSLVVVHNISLPPGQFGGDCVERLFTNQLDTSAHPDLASLAGVEVSSHFFIRRDGQVVQFVSTEARAWHAGLSVWQGRPNCNDYSIGIELEGCDTRPFEEAQYVALWALLAAIRDRYPEVAAVAGHEHVAPGRKTDPGPCFDWPGIALRFPDLALPAQVKP